MVLPDRSGKRNMDDKYVMDGHKLFWHLDRVNAWQRGELIAPLHIDVGLSKGCNIRCAYCFGAMQGNLFSEGAASFFPREPLLRYLQDAATVGVRSMAFIGEAEPLLNPHVYEAIVSGKKNGIDISLGTNGILFDLGRAGEEALEHLSWLRFNISAATPEAYLRVHGSELFNVVVAKIRHAVAVKHQLGLAVTIGLQMVLIPENVDQVLPLARLGRELGVDYLVVKQCSDTVDNTLGVFSRLHEYAGFSEALAEAEALSTESYAVIIKWQKVTNRGVRQYRRCLGVPFLLYSSGDGKLYPCGMFFNQREAEFRMGDLVTQSFREIVQSDRYWDVVRRVGEIDVCTECYVNCRTDSINDFLWRLAHPPEHVNFI
jgi:radical SAM protein with 4Fe4S-binding SPASM domain